MHSALIDLSGKHSEIWINFPWMLRLPGDSLLTSTLLLKADRRSDLQAFAVILTENHVGSDGFHLQHLPLSLHPPPPRMAQQLEPGKRYSGCNLGFADQAEHGVSLGISWPLDVLAHVVFVVVYLCMCVCLGAPTCNCNNVTADGFIDVQICWCGFCCAAQLHIKYSMIDNLTFTSYVS